MLQKNRQLAVFCCLKFEAKKLFKNTNKACQRFLTSNLQQKQVNFIASIAGYLIIATRQIIKGQWFES
ncbi:MAG: hypothetical protein WCJ51_00490 [Candidatus Moraniibacteriota bacterium]